MKIKLFTIPNCITLTNLLCGVGSIISSLVYNDLQMAFIFIIASAAADAHMATMALLVDVHLV